MSLKRMLLLRRRQYKPRRPLTPFLGNHYICAHSLSRHEHTHRLLLRHCSSSPIQKEIEQIASGSKGTEEPVPAEEEEEEHIEQIPEPSESGRRLLRDAIMFGVVGMIAAFGWTVWRQRRENYDSDTVTELYSVRAHIQHALSTQDMDTRIHHLSEAELHCRKALQDVGGGYLATATDTNASQSQSQSQTPSQTRIVYDPHIIALHIQLGKICYLLHKFQAAVDNYLVVLRALTQEFGYQSAELVTPCRQISDCYMSLGQYQMSQLFLERALKVIDGDDKQQQQQQQQQHREYGPICQQMAVLLRKQYQWQASIEYTNKAMKAAKSMLGEQHIQIAHMLLDRACCEMELKQWKTGEKSARHALQIVEFDSDDAMTASQRFLPSDALQSDSHSQTLADRVKDRFKESKTPQQLQHEQEMQMVQQQQQLRMNSMVRGVSSVQQMMEMKCSILFVIGQTLIEQERLNDAQMIFNNALLFATKLNDSSKQLLIQDQLADIDSMLKTTKT